MTNSAGAYFATEAAGLRRRTISGVMVTGAGQAVTFAFHFASIAILARLLSPADFGLVAMVTAVTGFITSFGDSGLSAATVQRATLTHEQVSTLFWINTALALLLTIATSALASPIAWFYGEPRLTWLAVATSAGFLFRGLAVQHAALLRRNLQFARLMLASSTGSFIGYSLGIVSALNGLGYWSLVVQSVGTAAATTAVTWLACRWRPGPPVRGAGVRAMLGFGGALTGSKFLNHLLRNFDNLLVGWYWGSFSLGLYSRAYAIMMLPMTQLNGPVNQVAMPALARVQSDTARFKEAYFRAVTLMAAVSLPACVFLIACAEPFVLTVLGEKWRDILPVFIALAPAAVLSTLTNSVGWVYNSLGMAGRQLTWTLCAVPIYLAGFAVALPFGPTAVAASFSILLCVLFVPTFWFAYRGTPLTVAALLGVLWRPLTTALTAGAVCWSSLRGDPIATLGLPQQLCLGAFIFAAVYGAAWLTLPGGKAQLRGTWDYIAHSLPRSSSSRKPNTVFAGK